MAVQMLPKNAVRHGWGANPHTAALHQGALRGWQRTFPKNHSLMSGNNCNNPALFSPHAPLSARINGWLPCFIDCFLHEVFGRAKAYHPCFFPVFSLWLLRSTLRFLSLKRSWFRFLVCFLYSWTISDSYDNPFLLLEITHFHWGNCWRMISPDNFIWVKTIIRWNGPKQAAWVLTKQDTIIPARENELNKARVFCTFIFSSLL